MTRHPIPLKDTRQFSPFFLDYIQGKAALRPFYSYLPTIQTFKEAIKNRKFPEAHRQVLRQSLERQYAQDGVQLFEEEKVQLDRLLDKQTFTVTTGHQLNLYTGPLYFMYKLVTTIRLAEELNKAYPDFHFVPIYWMATEDHDFEEINHFHLDGKKYAWASQQTGAVGNFHLDESFREFEKSIPFVAEIFKNAYGQAKTLKEAVREYVHQFFGHKGLLVMDAQEADLKGLFKQVIREDLFGHVTEKEVILKTESLESLGYPGQVFPRAINFFYLHKSIRERIELQGEDFVVLHTDLRFSKKEMEQLIEEHPERFSPNVILRPLYQETILPNLAYVGGPSELVYWLQLKGVFDHFSTAFPMLLPRNFALLLTPLIAKKIEALDWETETLFQDLQNWKRDFVRASASQDMEMSAEREQLSSIFDRKGALAGELDKSLEASFQAAKVRSMKILDQMGDKIRKAEERRLGVQLHRAEAVHAFAKPGGSPQERVVNMMQFYLEDPDFVEKLLASFDPVDFRMNVLQP